LPRPIDQSQLSLPLQQGNKDSESTSGNKQTLTFPTSQVRQASYQASLESLQLWEKACNASLKACDEALTRLRSVVVNSLESALSYAPWHRKGRSRIPESSRQLIRQQSMLLTLQAKSLLKLSRALRLAESQEQIEPLLKLSKELGVLHLEIGLQGERLTLHLVPPKTSQVLPFQ
jgi:hypothetical protein